MCFVSAISTFSDKKSSSIHLMTLSGRGYYVIVIFAATVHRSQGSSNIEIKNMYYL